MALILLVATDGGAYNALQPVAKLMSLKGHQIKRVDILNYFLEEGFRAHQDPPRYGPVNLSLTLQGFANYDVFEGPNLKNPVGGEVVGPGDLFLLHGPSKRQPGL